MNHMENQSEKKSVPDPDDLPESIQINQGNETILFVDDEFYLAEVGREMLEDYGYCVDTMTNPRKALEWFEKNPDRYDLLITDYTMPELTGNELVEKIHALRPELPVIMCTGIELSSEVFKKVRISKMLMKPFDMEQLIKGVREVLEKPGA
jgi:two-component system cell cycle sensor histidine kinase/response regulator CckA